MAAGQSDPAGRGADETGKETSLEDLVVAAVPGMITSLVLEAVKVLTGLQKLGVATGLAVLLWWLLRRRHGGKARPVGAVLRQWRWALVGLAGIAVLALALTVFTFGRPTVETSGVALLSLFILGGFALTGRAGPGATAAALCGALIGLCVGIAVL